MTITVTYQSPNQICKKMDVYKSANETTTARVICTNIENIKTETVLRPLCRLGATGVNGGFFDAENLIGFPNYMKPPTSGSSICYTKGLDGHMAEYEGVRRVKNFHENQVGDVAVAKKTMFIYNAYGGRVSVAYDYVKHIDELRNRFDVLYAIGGTDYNRNSWGEGYEKRKNRTVIAWIKPVVGVQTQVYLIQVEHVTIPELKVAMKHMNLDPVYSVIMDCGGSSGIQYHEGGKMINTSFQNRYLYNIVRLIKE